jgi:hypothetical protein
MDGGHTGQGAGLGGGVADLEEGCVVAYATFKAIPGIRSVNR